MKAIQIINVVTQGRHSVNVNSIALNDDHALFDHKGEIIVGKKSTTMDCGYHRSYAFKFHSDSAWGPERFLEMIGAYLDKGKKKIK